MRKREEQHRRIDADLVDARQLGGRDPPQQADARPARAPGRARRRASASRTLSESSARARRPRLAPSAARIASSCWRPSARTRNRFATFPQAMSSTTPTAARRIQRMRPMSPIDVVGQRTNVRLAVSASRTRRGSSGIMRATSALAWASVTPGFKPRQRLEVELDVERRPRDRAASAAAAPDRAQELERGRQHADDLGRRAIDLRATCPMTSSAPPNRRCQ